MASREAVSLRSMISTCSIVKWKVVPLQVKTLASSSTLTTELVVRSVRSSTGVISRFLTKPIPVTRSGTKISSRSAPSGSSQARETVVLPARGVGVVSSSGGVARRRGVAGMSEGTDECIASSVASRSRPA